MLQPWLIVLIALGYISLLFAIACYGDSRARIRRPERKPLVYSLSFGIFFTSWGFFGAVGQAATFGWAANPPLGSVFLLVPTYIGPYLLFLFGWHFLEKMVRVGKQHKTTSIADFISARYGKSQALGTLVAVIAVIAAIPYIAVQLKSIVWTYQILTEFDVEAIAATVPPLQDTGLYVALLLAVFSILFGVRHIDATEHHEGMMLAIAVESIVKVLAFLIVGGFITYGMFEGFDDLRQRIATTPLPLPPGASGQYTMAFFNSVFLSLIVIFTLPRHFHAASVEAADPRDIRVARWLFPLLLFGMSVFVWPVAAAGLLHFGPTTVDPDTYMLALPMAAGQPWLALLAFIGGLSAGASMVIIASVALAIMVCNDVVMPLLLRWRQLALHQRKDLSRLLLWIRRSAIFFILLAAFGYYRFTAVHVALAISGTLAFAAVAQFGPAVVGGLYWRRASKRGALIGLSVGFAVWIYTLLLPMLAPAGLVPMALIEQGPFGIAWLRPVALFGLEGLELATHGVFWSMLANLACYVGFSLGGQRRLVERAQAMAFVDPDGAAADPLERPPLRAVTVEELRILSERFLGPERAEAEFASYADDCGRPLAPAERAGRELLERIEQLLASVIGASSARIVLSSALEGRDVQLEDVAAMVGGASQMLQFNRDLLMSTFESVPQGISVVDRDLRLVGWNRRFVELFDYPDDFIKMGRRVAEIIRYQAECGEYGPVGEETEIVAYVATEMSRLRQEEPYVIERTRPDGTVLEVRGNPMPGGGFVTTYTDVTEYKRTERALRESEQNIRVYTDNVPVLIAYIDRDRRFRFANRAYETVLQLKREEIYGRLVDEVLPTAYMRGRAPHVNAVLEGRTRNFQVELSTPDGSLRQASATYIPDFSPDGEVLGFFALFHDITERVQAERALQEAKQHLEARVDERTRELTRANAALAVAKQEAERANLSKTRFLAAASHDLLQPLNAAVLFCGALNQRLEEGELAAMGRRIEHALRSAEDLLGELLDISKLDAGALKPQLSDFDVYELLQDLSVEFSALAQSNGLDFRSRPRHCVVHSDRQLLRRILQNFLANAIRYTPSGQVLLGCRRQGGQLRIEVWDTGPGIPEDQQEQIFLEFHRLEQHDEQGEKCLGLGLAIADRISRMLNHPISLRSRLGRGTVFAITLPLGVAKPLIVATPATSMPGGRLAGMHVLCIDNEPAILDGMRALLQGWSCQVSVAADIASAERLIIAADEPVDLVLADYRLARGETGIEAMNALRQLVDYPLPGVLITADQAPLVRELARVHGYQFLAKPVRPAVLRAILDATSQRVRVS